MSCLTIQQLENGNVVVSEFIEFNPLKKQEYLDLFQENIEKGIIKQGTDFFGKKWILIIGGVEHSIVFMNDIELKKCSKLFDITITEFELAIRSFILYNLYKPRAIVKFLIPFKKLINTQSINKNTGICLYNLLDAFLKYITIPNENKSYFNVVLNRDIKSVDSEPAVIPDFEDIFLIADIVNDIIENKNLSDYHAHLLFIMWWKLCSVLPLRPSEFLATDFSCIYKIDNKCYLKVYRTKGKTIEHIENISKKEDYYREDTILIDSSTYNLILTYREILTTQFGYTEKKDLFPFDLIRNVGNYILETREINKDIVISRDIIYAIDRFYKYVINKEYGFTTLFRYDKKKPNIDYVSNINPKDLRHIAIINLVLLGCDVLDVMRLAGHTDINSAFGYYNHVKEFSKGYALGYMKSILNKEKMKNKNKNLEKKLYSEDIERKKRAEEARRILAEVKGHKLTYTHVDGGKCYYSELKNDKTFCLLYECNHFQCPHFVSESKAILLDELEKIEHKIDTKILILEDLIRDMNNISKFNEIYQSNSFELAMHIRDMAHLNKKILEEE